MSAKSFNATNKENRLFRCPFCGSRKIARIQWGRPSWSETLEEKLDSGKLTLGGCSVDVHAPKWQCLDCNTCFGESDTWDLEFVLNRKLIPDYLQARLQVGGLQDDNSAPLLVTSRSQGSATSEQTTRPSP